MQPKDWKGHDSNFAPPTVFTAENGHWGGFRDTGNFIPDTDVITDPHIQVYDGSRTLVFDSADKTVRKRSLGYDSEKGIVTFAQSVPEVTIPYSPAAGSNYGD